MTMSDTSLPSRAQMLSETICETARSLFQTDGFVALHEPHFAGNEWEYVKECLDTGWVSTAGKFVDEFEKRLSEFTGVPYAIAVVNGTSALHVCLQLSGIEAGHEVLLPAVTFVATANAVSYIGAIPHLIDCDSCSLGIDVEKLRSHLARETVLVGGRCTNKRTGREITALIAVHVFGHMVDMDPLGELCAEYHLTLVEDAAEALGSYYRGTHAGSFGRLSALSFNGNKIITTGGGGAILTGDEQLATIAKHITTTAKPAHPWEFGHDAVGFNYRLPNINAALGCAQMEQLNAHLERKRRLFSMYCDAFQDVDGVSVLQGPSYSRGNCWLNAIVLDNRVVGERDNVLRGTNGQGIMTRPLWTPMHMLPMYTHCPRMDMTETERMYRRVIAIPSSPQLIGGRG